MNSLGHRRRNLVAASIYAHARCCSVIHFSLWKDVGIKVSRVSLRPSFGFPCHLPLAALFALDLSCDSAALWWGASDFAPASTPAQPAAASGGWRGSRGVRWAAEALRNPLGFGGRWTGPGARCVFFPPVSVTLARSFDVAGPSVPTCKRE